MIDIVEKLRRHIGLDELDADDQVACVPRWEVEEAINEIERLRGLLREWVDSPCQPIAVDILRRTQEALDHD